MASSFSVLCARRATLSTKSHHTPSSASVLTSSLCCGATQTRSRYRAYATVSNKRPKVLHDVWGEIPEVPRSLFTKWFDATREAQRQDKDHKWLRFEDQEYFNAIDMFRQAAPKFGSDWTLKLKKELRPDPALLNDLGSVIARYSPQVDSLNERLPVATVIQWAMFSGAAHLGCRISTHSMARWIAIASYYDKDISKRPLFRPIMDLHRTYLDEGRPMALYVEGEYLLRTGKTDAAIRVLTRAYEDTNNTVLWWPDMCNALGIAHNMNDDTQTALRYWGTAVQAGSLDALKSYYQYTSSGEVRDDAMYKLACKGDLEVLGEIAAMETRKATEDKFATPGEKQFQEKWASEWMKMAHYDVQARRNLSGGLSQSAEADTDEEKVKVQLSDEGMHAIERVLEREKAKHNPDKQ